MKSRETTLRLKRFEAQEKARKVVGLEQMIRDFEVMAGDLERQVQAEEDRTGVKDVTHFAYSTFAKSAAQRRANLVTSLTDLKAKLDAAKRDHEDAASELSKLEPAEDRERSHLKADPRVMIG